MAFIRIPIDELKVGMYVEKVESTAVSCPIKQAGYIRSEAILMALKQYRIQYVVIDPNKDKEPQPQPQHEPEKTIPTHIESELQKTSLSNRVAKVIDLAAQAKNQLKDLCSRVESLKTEDFKTLETTAADINNILASDPVSTMLLIKLSDAHSDIYDHSINTAILAGLFTNNMGFEPAIRFQVILAGLLHDIGLTTVPQKIITKKSTLSELERRILNGHVDLTIEILDRQHRSISDICISAIKHHHEHIDGSGYPNKLTGDDISLWGKILSIIDTYETITSARYRDIKKTNNEAMAILLKESGKHFDAPLVAMFTQFMQAYPVGSCVLCCDTGREYLGIVIKTNKSMPLKPSVAIFFNIKENKKIEAETYNLADDECSYELVKAVNIESYFKNFDAFEFLSLLK